MNRTVAGPTTFYSEQGNLMMPSVGPEPICPQCGTPILWVLDMASWTHTDEGFVLLHARCAWEPEAFTKQRRLAQQVSP